MFGTLRLILTALIAIVSLLVLLIPYALARLFSSRAAMRVSMAWHRIVLWAIGVRVTVSGEPSRERPLLLLVNHISWLDIIVLAATLPVSFIAKKEVAGWPVFNWLAQLQRSIFVDRQRRTQTRHASDHVARRMAGGEIIVLFAEGTSTDGNDVRPFRSALIGAAQRAVDGEQLATVQPVAIAYTGQHGLPIDRAQRSRIAWFGDMDLMPHLIRVLKEGNIDVQLVFTEPDGIKRDGDRKALAAAAGAKVKALVAALNTGRTQQHLAQEELI